MTALAGVDGCKAGWVAVWRVNNEADLQTAVFANFSTLVATLPATTLFAVDMPIGLPDFTCHGGRGPEQAVRPLLKQRQSSVFSVPSRSAVYAECAAPGSQAEIIAAHKRASIIALQTSDPPRKISIQAFMLFPKIREIDTELRTHPQLVSRVFESHPEYAFTVLNGGEPMTLPKKIRGAVNEPGMEGRRALLAGHKMPKTFLDQTPPKGAASDDFLDACAMLLIAGRIADGSAVPNPSPLIRDSYGLPVAIWA